MNLLLLANGGLLIRIISEGDLAQMPKQLVLLDSQSNAVWSQWIRDENEFVRENLLPGLYLVRLILPSGNVFCKVVEIRQGEPARVELDISKAGNRQGFEWAYFNKGASNRKGYQRLDEPSFATVNAVEYNNGIWASSVDTVPRYQAVSGFGEQFEIQSHEEEQYLRLLHFQTNNQRPVFVCLPHARHVRCFIKNSGGPANMVHPLDVTVSTEHWRAEALLTLITEGDSNSAQSFFGHYSTDFTVPQLAEELLYSKVKDPTSAAIGGYYLLQNMELERTHDWITNLANWFPRLPDGAVLHAWRQLYEERYLSDETIERVHARLLQAIGRGIPVYSKGVRLLYEGLQMLSKYYRHRDHEILEALDLVCVYMDGINWRKGLTTFSIDQLPDHSPFARYANVNIPQGRNESSNKEYYQDNSSKMSTQNY